MLAKNDEEQEKLPSVDSLDMDERIMARRLRIEKRVAAQKRAEMGDVKDEVVPVELTKSKKQLEFSRQRITKLLRDGNDFFTNIKVAGDARENSRRIDNDEANRLLTEKLENEAKVSLDRFEEITKKWEIASQKDVPQDLQEMLHQQKEACYNLIEDKNKLISDLKMELQASDDRYVKDLKKQVEDIDLMIERMDEQVKMMTNTYKDEMIQVEKAFINQRDDLLDSQKQRWQELLTAIRNKQDEYLVQRQNRVDDFESQLKELRIQHAEEYNGLKIKLETDVQVLEQKLQMMKATYQLNLEKLEYNFQVLKKRDEENAITKSQQKRRITKLQDLLNNLKIKLGKQEKQFVNENEQLGDDYKRVTEQFKDLQKKSKSLLGSDSKKFQDIWIMNEEELKELTRKLLAADKIISEQQLGLQWQSPNIDFMNNVGPIVSEAERAKITPASNFVKDIYSKSEQDPLDTINEEGQITPDTSLSNISPAILKSILDVICDESGFLVESKLKKLLMPLKKNEQSLMRLDAIFSALGIKSENDIKKLLQYFLKHGSEQQNVVKDSIVNPDNTTILEFSSEAAPATESDQPSEIAPSYSKSSEDSTSYSQKKDYIIHPNDVVKVMKGFVEEFHIKSKSSDQASGKHSQFILTDLENRDTSQDADYWKSYCTLIDSEKEKLWDALIGGLEKYSETLTARSNLITETDALRVQNAELKHLLQQYIKSKVNCELEIPPTKTMQINNI